MSGRRTQSQTKGHNFSSKQPNKPQSAHICAAKRESETKNTNGAALLLRTNVHVKLGAAANSIFLELSLFMFRPLLSGNDRR
jgi:hypothetical protein